MTDPEQPLVDTAFEAPEVSSEPAALRVMLTTPDGPSPALRAHEEIKATLVTRADAYAYCYYADGTGSISRIQPCESSWPKAVRTTPGWRTFAVTPEPSSRRASS